MLPITFRVFVYYSSEEQTECTIILDFSQSWPPKTGNRRRERVTLNDDGSAAATAIGLPSN